MNKSNNTRSGYMPIPETFTRRKLNALYREVPLKDSVSRTMRKYFNAMAHLYGIVPLAKAYEIISQQSPSLVSKDEFLAFAEIARHECEGYFILGAEEIYMDGRAGSPFEREIIDVTLLGVDDLYIQTKQLQQGKPYFVPEKKQLLLYNDAFYYEATPEAVALKRFLTERFKLDETQEAAIFIQILDGARYSNADYSTVMTYLHDKGLAFESEADVRKFVALQQNFHNTTRMQCNRGYTPDELFRRRPPKERIPQSISLGPNIRKAIADGTADANELRKGVLTMELPSEELRFSLLKEIADAEKAVRQQSKPQKIGRNDPCPCGSGKKYKKCCGR